MVKSSRHASTSPQILFTFLNSSRALLASSTSSFNLARISRHCAWPFSSLQSSNSSKALSADPSTKSRRSLKQAWFWAHRAADRKHSAAKLFVCTNFTASINLPFLLKRLPASVYLPSSTSASIASWTHPWFSRKRIRSFVEGKPSRTETISSRRPELKYEQTNKKLKSRSSPSKNKNCFNWLATLYEKIEKRQQKENDNNMWWKLEKGVGNNSTIERYYK